MNLLQKISSWK